MPKKLKLVLITLISLVALAGLVSLVFAAAQNGLEPNGQNGQNGQNGGPKWQEPAEAPPGGQVPAPINVGSDDQYKKGYLAVGTGEAHSDAALYAEKTGNWAGYFQGNVNINGELCIQGDCITDWSGAGLWEKIGTYVRPKETLSQQQVYIDKNLGIGNVPWNSRGIVMNPPTGAGSTGIDILSGANFGIYVRGANNYGIYARGSRAGVYGRLVNPPSGDVGAVHGVVTADHGGYEAGVFGEITDTTAGWDSYGVFGRTADPDTGGGVRGEGGEYGVYGQGSAVGVTGTSTGDWAGRGRVGVRGFIEGDDTTGMGVIGSSYGTVADSGSKKKAGVMGEWRSPGKAASGFLGLTTSHPSPCTGTPTSCAGRSQDKCDQGCSWKEECISSYRKDCDNSATCTACCQYEGNACTWFSCFLEGTQVMISDGTKLIQEIKKGDLVKSFSLKNKEVVYSKVSSIYSRRTNYYYIINDKIKVTEEHPFYTSQGWKKVKELVLGDKLFDGIDYIKIEDIRKIDEEAKVYNLTVDSFHNYFVEGILVHNKQADRCECGTAECSNNVGSPDCEGRDPCTNTTCWNCWKSEKCEGTPNPCSNYGDEATCAKYGCTWSLSATYGVWGQGTTAGVYGYVSGAGNVTRTGVEGYLDDGGVTSYAKLGYKHYLGGGQANWYGVYAKGATYGVYGESPYGLGTLGDTQHTGAGVYGQGGHGVLGFTTSGTWGEAVVGVAHNSSTLPDAWWGGARAWGALGRKGTTGEGIGGRAYAGVYGSVGTGRSNSWAGYFDGDVNITGNLILEDKPIKILRYKEELKGIFKKNTGVSTTDWTCTTGSFWAKGGDINEHKPDSNTKPLVFLWTYEEGGKWWVKGDFRSRGDDDDKLKNHEVWDFDVICIKRTIASYEVHKRNTFYKNLSCEPDGDAGCWYSSSMDKCKNWANYVCSAWGYNGWIAQVRGTEGTCWPCQTVMGCNVKCDDTGEKDCWFRYSGSGYCAVWGPQCGQCPTNKWIKCENRPSSGDNPCPGPHTDTPNHP